MALVTLVMAMSLDGKIARVARRAEHFGEADAERFERLCAAADALVTGAGSLRAQGATRSIVRPELLAARRAEGRPEQPLTVVVSRGGLLDLEMPFFTRQRVRRAVATTSAGAAHAARYAGLAEVWDCGPRVEPRAVLDRLAAAGCERIALLGGGELNAAWFAAGLVDRLELTLAPCLFGGASAPTPLDGPGLAVPMSAELEACETVAGCLFLSYRLLKEPADG
jgi:5-amino-6-(5-phosphoribosylamino)uracil reductase